MLGYCKFIVPKVRFYELTCTYQRMDLCFCTFWQINLYLLPLNAYVFLILLYQRFWIAKNDLTKIMLKWNKLMLYYLKIIHYMHNQNGVISFWKKVFAKP